MIVFWLLVVSFYICGAVATFIEVRSQKPWEGTCPRWLGESIAIFMAVMWPWAILWFWVQEQWK